MMTPVDRMGAFQRALGAIASGAGAGAPLLYGPNGRALPPSVSFGVRREGARNSGAMKGWRPRQYTSPQAEAMDRAEVVRRACDLADNDPHAAGLLDTYAASVIGSGLVPHPNPDQEALGISKEVDQRLTTQMRVVYRRWNVQADAGERHNFGQIQYLARLSKMRHGEFFMLLPMLKDKPWRHYSLACQLIHPSRVKTPIDLVSRGDIRDGIELGEYGEPVAAWVKRSGKKGVLALSDTKANFLRVPFRVGHRRCLIHSFITKDPEQVRGWPLISPAIKYFRSFNDLLDAELISNVITAAMAYFIETNPGEDPYDFGNRRASSTEPCLNGNGASVEQRWESVNPGQIWYGSSGQKPHLLSANRPGTTFEPFTKTVKKSLSMAANLPHVIGFKDFEETSFAGARMAMLEAWRVFAMERDWDGADTCQPVFTSLMEEAWLRGEIDYPADKFYRDLDLLTASEWRGAPKGDIEPVKAAQADVLLNKASAKTKEQMIIERGGDPQRVFAQLEDEMVLLESKGLPVYGPDVEINSSPDKEETDAE